MLLLLLPASSPSCLIFYRGYSSTSNLNTYIVDDNRVECRNADFTSIQAAVVAANPGDTIKVCPGTYIEQVTIPASKDNLKLESTRRWEAIIKAPPIMADPKAIVLVRGAMDVEIRNFTISGPGGGPCDSLRYGVRVDGGGSAEILGNHITQIRDTPFSGCQNGNAIQIGRRFESQTGTALIQDNLIDNYQKSGIVVDNVGSSADIEKNEITGIGPTVLIAQNGIQISRGATADVKQNEISGNVYSPGIIASSTGILLFNPGTVEISHNDIYLNDVGVYVSGAQQAVISHNSASRNTYDGIDLLDGTTNTTVSHNRSFENGLDGIYAGTDSAGNTIEHNRMDNNAEHDAHDDSVGPGTGGTANFWEHNNCNTENRPGLCHN